MGMADYYDWGPDMDLDDPLIDSQRPITVSNDPNIWVTKAGQSVQVRDLTNTHLINIIRFLRRAAAAREVAVADIEADMCIQWPALQAEAKKRGLKTGGR